MDDKGIPEEPHVVVQKGASIDVAAPTPPPLPERPDDRLTVTYKGNEKVLFMSFLRQNALLRIMDNPQSIMMLQVDPDLSELSIKALLAEKPENFAAFELEETDLSQEDFERIIDWVQDSMSYFFMKRFRKMGEKADSLEPLAKALLSSAPGSKT